MKYVLHVEEHTTGTQLAIGMKAHSCVCCVLQTQFLHKAVHVCLSSSQITISSGNLKIKIQNTYSILSCFYGCETRSVALREGHRIIVRENKQK